MTWKSVAAIACVGLLCTVCTSDGDRPGIPATSTQPTRSLTVEGRIVFAGEDGEIHVVELPSGKDAALTSIRGDQFDPDGHGRLVVFRDSRDGVNVDDEIYLVRSNGKDLVNLTNSPDSNEWGPAWSPDGTEIAFNSDREGRPQVYVMNADGTRVEQLSDIWGEYPTWSPDGRRIAFESYMGGSTPFGDPDYDVFVMEADGSIERNLTSDPDSYDGYPTWSPDGEWIAFESTRATPEDFEPPAYDQERISDFDIWAMRADGTDIRNVTDDLVTIEKFPDWSDGGIVYVREGAIVVVSPEGSSEFDVSEQTGIYGQFPAWVA
jgi:Tol biopolymer transport system component